MLEGNPLENLPSKPGPHIDGIKAMEPGSWLGLGSPAADPKWGRARGRSWGGHAMVPAPDLRGAMFAGEGVHAYVKPDGYGMDDWWFYDINAHAWICIWPGTNTKEFNRQVREGELKVDKDGRAVDASGQPVPGHILIHTYHWLTYNSDQKKFVLVHNWPWFAKYYMPGGKAVYEGIDALQAQGLRTRRSPGKTFAPFAYNTRTGRFERPIAQERRPYGDCSFGFFEYIPDKKQYIFINKDILAYLDTETGKWQKVSGKPPLVSTEFTGCYDSTRRRIYCGESGNNYYCVDLEDHSWERIRFPDSDASLFGKGHALGVNTASAIYDAANDRVLVFHFPHRRRGKGKIYPIDPESNEVLEPIPFDAGFEAIRRQSVAFYDPKLGVSFVFTAGDSRDNGTMWALK
jgi:hypothetical protein